MTGTVAGALRRPASRRGVGAAVFALLGTVAAAAEAPAPLSPADLAQRYEREVTPRLVLPADEQTAYAARLSAALDDAGVRLAGAQYVVLVDRNATAQAVMVWWVDREGAALLIGASPASTGRPAGFEHFETPTGVFEHSLAAPDFRAEGTPNALGIRGYGVKDMRVYDFGWVDARRGWAAGAQPMRLQMHSTDPDRLEPRLGQRASKGCIRIPATLNTLIDRHGLLDAAYEEALAAGETFWVLRADRQPALWSGRYLVVVDSARGERPAWSLAPGHSARP